MLLCRTMSSKGKGKRSKGYINNGLNGNVEQNGQEKRCKISENGNGKHALEFTLNLRSPDSKDSIEADLQRAWRDKKNDFISEKFKVLQNPFTCCNIKNFVETKDLVHSLIQVRRPLHIDPLGQPTFMAGKIHCFRTCCPSPLFKI